MNDLDYDIEQLWIEGWGPTKIADLLDCHVDLVHVWIKGQNLSEIDNAYDPYATVNS